MIHGSELLPIPGRLPNMFHLSRNRRYRALAGHCQLCRNRPSIDASAAAVIADPVPESAYTHRVVVNVMNDRDIHIGHGSGGGEYVSIPVAAFVASANVAVAVVDTAVEADMRSPITAMPAVPATFII